MTADAHRAALAPSAWLWGGAAALVAGGAAYLGTHDPHVPGAYPPCVLLSITGFYCPACGGTRAAYDLLHGDVAGAFARNPAVPVLLVLTVVGLGVRVWRRRSGREVRPVSVWVPVAIALALLVFGILRNLPGWDFLSPA